MKRILVLLVTILTITGCSEDTPPTMYTLSVTSNPTESGTINPTTGEYEEGTEVTITVTPNLNYEFDKWSGSWSGSESPLTLIMDGDKNLVGNFKLMDSDGDGVTDIIDQCNTTPSGQSVDENGCSDSEKDTDGDGVTDDVDTCPDTPEGESVDENGCSDSQKDTDSDGVTDDVDTCPDTPEGESVDENGCSDSQKDTDSDGVTDDVDTCPDTPEGESVDENGCSDSQKDTDGDGVTDDIDNCPDTDEGINVDEIGCEQAPLYLDENGVTIKARNWVNIGDTGEINGETYTVVDETTLKNMIQNNEDVSKVVTSRVTNMIGLFEENTSFNQDISSWDVSNVTNMERMINV
jgi:surface protein